MPLCAAVRRCAPLCRAGKVGFGVPPVEVNSPVESLAKLAASRACPRDVRPRRPKGQGSMANDTVAEQGAAVSASERETTTFSCVPLLVKWDYCSAVGSAWVCAYSFFLPKTALNTTKELWLNLHFWMILNYSIKMMMNIFLLISLLNTPPCVQYNFFWCKCSKSMFKSAKKLHQN